MKSAINSWLVFFAVILLEIALTRSFAAVLNISVIGCGFMTCSLCVDKEFDCESIVKCIYLCGLFICVTVLIEGMTGIFKSMPGIYTEETQLVRQLYHGIGGGILPHSASAGCFIYSGFGAYIALSKYRKQNLFRSNSIIIIIVFALCMILIRKRGFIFHFLISVFMIWLLSIRREDFGTINLNRQIKAIGSVTLAVIVFIIMYKSIPLFNDGIKMLLDKFNKKDTSSGRIELYALAIQLFRSNIFFGIGWGRFRTYTVGFFGIPELSYAAHNVYIQLLCETGIIGVVFFIFALIRTLMYGIKKYRKLIQEGTNNKKSFVALGIYLQLFFIFYCLTGNPLYDYNFLIMYFIGVLLTTISINVNDNKRDN